MAISDNLIEKIHQSKSTNTHGFFDKVKTKKWVKDLYEVLFLPQNDNTEDHLKKSFENLQQTFSTLIGAVAETKEDTEEQVNRFFKALPAVYDQLVLDAKSILEFDPAAESLEEVYLAYPGFLPPMFTGSRTSCGSRRSEYCPVSFRNMLTAKPV